MHAIGMALRQNETFFLQSKIKFFTHNAVCVFLKKYKPLNAKENRFLAYISQLRIKMRYVQVQGKINRVADALSRLPADIKTSEIYSYKAPERLKDEEFIFAVTEPIEDSNTVELMTDCENKANIWTAYRIQYDTAENTQEKLHELNPNAKIFCSL